MNVYQGERFFPFGVALELTLACNMQCLHCGSSANTRGRADSLEFGEWLQVIAELKRLQAKYITLTGGEPLLYPHWRELIEHINRNNDNYTKVSVITNGSILTEADIIFMKAQHLTHLAVSLDGDETTHDFIRQYPGSYQKVRQVVEWCNKHHFRVGLVTSFNKYNFELRNSLLQMVLESGADSWQVQIVNSFGRAGEKRAELLIDPEQYVRLIDDVYQWKSKYDRQLKIYPADSLGYCHPKTEALFGDTNWAGCSAGMYNIGIEANGNVKGCLSLQSDDFIVGNVREKSLVDIWFDDQAFSYTRNYNIQLMEGACRECRDAQTCKAGCLGMAYSVNHTLYENPYCYQSILGIHKDKGT
jgi:radical SAM protein with 4Fe4S-binding SPASM domain